MATRVFDRIKFYVQFLNRNIPAKFGPNWPSGFGEDVERNCWRRTTTDGHRTSLKAPLEHVVLRLAKKRVKCVSAMHDIKWDTI